MFDREEITKVTTGNPVKLDGYVSPVKYPLYKILAITSTSRDRDFTRYEEHLPRGSGVCALKVDSFSDVNMLIINFSYHHMSSTGFYVGYSEWRLEVTCDLTGLKLDFLQTNTEDNADLLVDVFEDDEGGLVTAPMVDECFIDYLHDTFIYALEKEYSL